MPLAHGDATSGGRSGSAFASGTPNQLPQPQPVGAGRRGATVGGVGGGGGGDLDFLFGDDGGGGGGGRGGSESRNSAMGGSAMGNPPLGATGRQRSTVVSFLGEEESTVRDPLGATVGPNAAAAPPTGRRSGAATPSEAGGFGGGANSGTAAGSSTRGDGDTFLYEDDFVDETASVASRQTPAAFGGSERSQSAVPFGRGSSAVAGGGGRRGGFGDRTASPREIQQTNDDEDLESIFSGGGGGGGGRQSAITSPQLQTNTQRSGAAAGGGDDDFLFPIGQPNRASSGATNAAAGSSSSAAAEDSATIAALREEIAELRAAAEAYANKPPKSLEEQHAELLAELHEAEALLLKQTVAAKAADSALRRLTEGNAVAESGKRVELTRAQGAADLKMREAAAYGQRRVAEAKAAGAKEAAEAVASHEQMLKDRNERTLRELAADIKLATAEIAKLEGQKELLLLNGTIEAPAAAATTAAAAAGGGGATKSSASAGSAVLRGGGKAAYVRLLDAKSVDAKLDAAVEMLMEEHKAADARLERRVADHIHLEASALVSETWEQRHRSFVAESIARRDAFSAFKTELLEGAAAFYTRRQEGRAGDVKTIQDLVTRNIEAVRERTIAVTRRAEAEAKAQFEELTAAFKANYSQTLAAKAAQQKAIIAEDERALAAQADEARSRHQMARRLAVRLHTEEVDTLRAVLEREAERNALLNHGNSGSLGAGSTRHHAEEAAAHMKQLRALADSIGAALSTQTDRNRSFKAAAAAAANGEALPFVPSVAGALPSTGASSALAALSAAAAAGGGGGGALMPMAAGLAGLTREEAHLAASLGDQQAVLAATHRTVTEQLGQLEATREGLGALVDSLEVKLSTMLREIHDARLGQQTQLSKAEAVRAQWEREHRAMLAHKNVDCGAFLTSATEGLFGGGGVSEQQQQELRDVYGLYPALGIALQLASVVRNAAVAQHEKSNAFAERRSLLLQTQREGDAAAAEESAALQQAWERTLAAVLALNEGTKGLTERQVAVLGEGAKLGVERELLEHERRALAQRAADLGREAAAVSAEYEGLQSQGAEVAAAARRLEREQESANRELRTLVVLQGDLRHQQAAHYAQASRLDKMKQRLLGSWGSSEGGYGGSSSVSASLSEGGGYAHGGTPTCGGGDAASSGGTRGPSTGSSNGGGGGVFSGLLNVTTGAPPSAASYYGYGRDTSLVTAGDVSALASTAAGNALRVQRGVGNPYNYLDTTFNTSAGGGGGGAFNNGYGAYGGGYSGSSGALSSRQHRPAAASATSSGPQSGTENVETRTPTTTSISKGSNAPSFPPSSSATDAEREGGRVAMANGNAVPRGPLGHSTVDPNTGERQLSATMRPPTAAAASSGYTSIDAQRAAKATAGPMPTIVRGSMQQGAAGGNGESSDDEDDDDKTDAYSEQAHSQFYSQHGDASSVQRHLMMGQESYVAAMGDTSGFTQLRHVSPSMNTSAAPSLEASPRR